MDGPDAAPAKAACEGANLKHDEADMTPAERKIYSRMADGMTYFHNHFKSTWQLLHTACDNNQRPAGMSIKQFLRTASDFVQHLEMHHSIEEAHIFPVLARRMPVFAREMELLGQHKQIHKGIERLEEYVMGCRTGEKELRLDEMKGLLDSFGPVLLQHLDEEVQNLGAENMRKYWTLKEMRDMPM